jgi:hypothetical protein
MKHQKSFCRESVSKKFKYVVYMVTISWLIVCSNSMEVYKNGNNDKQTIKSDDLNAKFSKSIWLMIFQYLEIPDIFTKLILTNSKFYQTIVDMPFANKVQLFNFSNPMKLYLEVNGLLHSDETLKDNSRSTKLLSSKKWFSNNILRHQHK